MTSRNRQAKIKARIGIAAAVLVGGGAIGAVAVASSGHNATTSAQSAGYSLSRHSMPVSTALSSAMTALQHGQQSKAMTMLAAMAPMRNFTQTHHNQTTMVMQRGIVELATKRFLLVKSANGQQHLWWIRGAQIVNAASTTTGMTAMTGSTTAATAAMSSGNMAPATTAMAGSTTAASAMTAAAAKPITITVNAGGQTITITITSGTATVSAPATTPSAVASPTAMPTASASATAMPTASASASAMPTASASAMPTAGTGGPMTTSTQSAFATSNGLKRGDMVLVTGVRQHGLLVAKMVLFAAPATTTTTPTATPTATTSVAPTAPATTNVAPSASSSQFTGTHS